MDHGVLLRRNEKSNRKEKKYMMGMDKDMLDMMLPPNLAPKVRFPFECEADLAAFLQQEASYRNVSREQLMRSVLADFWNGVKAEDARLVARIAEMKGRESGSEQFVPFNFGKSEDR